MAPTCFSLRPSSGSLQMNPAKVILILRHSVRLFGGVLYSAQHTVHTSHWDMLPHHRITTLLNVLISI